MRNFYTVLRPGAVQVGVGLETWSQEIVTPKISSKRTTRRNLYDNGDGNIVRVTLVQLVKMIIGNKTGFEFVLMVIVQSTFKCRKYTLSYVSL